MSWIHEYRLGGGAGIWTDDNEARDTDTRDPNIVDLLVPAARPVTVLDWRAGAPVVVLRRAGIDRDVDDYVGHSDRIGRL